MSEELKPCPFCGGYAEICDGSCHNWLVYCTSCDVDIECDSHAKCVLAWNTRQPDKELALPVKSHHCTTTHSACDCVLDRLTKLEQQNKELVAENKALKKQISELLHYGCFVPDEGYAICLIAAENKELVAALDRIMSKTMSHYTSEGAMAVDYRRIAKAALAKHKENK